MPQKLQNTLTEYSFSKKDILGVTDEREDNYDLMSVIIIRRGKESDEKGIFDYLNGVFSCDIKRVEKYSHIKWSEPFQKEVGKMTGFGDMIYERGMQEGLQEGMILGMLISGKTPEETAKILKISLEEVKKAQEKLLEK